MADFAWTVNIHTVSEPNRRGEHWSVAQKRSNPQRLTAKQYTRQVLGYPADMPKPSTVKLIRIAPRDLDDDNLRGALKHVRDGVADAFGCDDSARAGIRWDYGQEKPTTPRFYAVRVEVSL